MDGRSADAAIRELIRHDIVTVRWKKWEVSGSYGKPAGDIRRENWVRSFDFRFSRFLHPSSFLTSPPYLPSRSAKNLDGRAAATAKSRIDTANRGNDSSAFRFWSGERAEKM
jgi:hypothetical protein